MTIIQPGMLTSVQDTGRYGHRCDGVPTGGAVDAVSMQLANLAVGNPAAVAGLECTLVGPRVRFSQDALIAVAGATVQGIEPLRPILVRAGKPVSLEKLSRGCRSYLAVAGGIDVPTVLGSRSTALRSGFGGFQGRPLRRGDVLPIGTPPPNPPRNCRIDARCFGAGLPSIRITSAHEHVELATQFCEATYTISHQSDRMGLRLTGGRDLPQPEAIQLSRAVAPGTIQRPPGGEPIVLLADAQTVGGYAVIGHVIAADLHHLAQLRPRDTILFSLITLDEAAVAAKNQRSLLRTIALGMSAAQRRRI